MRKSSLYLTLTAFFFTTFLLSLADGVVRSGQRVEKLRPCSEMVQRLQLTDLALFTEARYTRHPSQADLHSSFQDHPMALEHFPTGSLVRPPAHLR
jgi:hypothetical protein